MAARRPATAVARLATLALVGVGMAAAGVATAQAPPSFPPAFEREPLLTWLKRETDITPERVVAVTPQVVTAVVSTFPSGGGQGPRVVIRAEALSPETHARTGALSWHVSMTADCAGHRVRLGETTGYPERNLLGERRVLRPPEPDWRVPEAGTALDNAWRLVCDRTFVGPFQDGANHVTRDDAPPPEASAPAAAAPAAPPPATAPPVTAPPVTAPPPKPPRAPRATPISTAAQAPAAPPRGAGGVAVQVGSYPDVASANAALATLRDGRAHGVEQAKVGGRTWYRVVVSGFATAAEAAYYCSQHQAAGGACFVRAAPNG